jgi:hypothetical protein
MARRVVHAKNPTSSLSSKIGGDGAGERTLSRILWKSTTLSPGILQASHSRYHFLSRTGLPNNEMYLRFFNSFRGSRSPNSAILLFVRTRVVKFGTDRWIDGEIADIRLFERRSVWRRLSNGKLPSVTMALSVKSIASCWSCGNDQDLVSSGKKSPKTRTLVTPRFSIVGIL